MAALPQGENEWTDDRSEESLRLHLQRVGLTDQLLGELAAKLDRGVPIRRHTGESDVRALGSDARQRGGFIVL